MNDVSDNVTTKPFLYKIKIISDYIIYNAGLLLLLIGIIYYN